MGRVFVGGGQGYVDTGAGGGGGGSGNAGAVLANHAIVEMNVNPGVDLPGDPKWGPIALIESFTMTPGGSGKLHVEGTVTFFNSDVNPQGAAVGVAIVASGAAAPLVPDYPTGIGDNEVGILAGRSGHNTIFVDYGGGGSFPSALTPGSSYDIYLLGSADAPLVINTREHSGQLTAQEQG